MDKLEKGEIAGNVSTGSAGPSSLATEARQRQLFPPPQSAQPNYISYGNETPAPAVNGSTYQNNGKVTDSRERLFASYNEKSVVEAYLLAFIFGLLGAHHFYLHRHYWGIVYFFTGGLLGCGYLIDLFRVPCLVKQANEKIRNPGIENDRKTICDTYTLWFPFGLLGFHHYYLRNYGWGVIYTCTGGLFGIGWIVDAFRIPYLVKSANEQHNETEEKNTCLSVALGVSVLGALGAHHYYLNRPIWGIVYTFTLGLGSVGWIADWFRMHVLIKRANKVISGERSPNIKTLDDAYILWFPFGLLGFHHFYLERPVWGFLYFFTLGIVGLGWLVDACRIPSLVKTANLKIENERLNRTLVSNTAGRTNEASTVSGPVAGYPYYTMAHPVEFSATNQSVPYPSQETFGHNYQQGAYGYPHISQNGPYQNSVHGPTANYSNVYNGAGIGGPEFLPPYQPPPPPYQPAQSNAANNQADDVIKKQ